MSGSLSNERQFGLLIAYVIPGFVAVHGLSYRVPGLSTWLAHQSQPTIGGFLYATLASVAAGLIVSALRWMTVDPLLYATGVTPSRWNISELREQLPAFEMLVLYNYRYYQFYSNCFIATPLWFFLKPTSLIPSQWIQYLILAFVECVLIVGARDTLKKYCARTNAILEERGSTIISLSTI